MSIDIGQLNGWPSIIKYDEEGNIVAAIIMHSIPQLEFFINEEYREQGLWIEMAELMKQCAVLVKPYIAVCRNEKVAHMAEKMGMVEIEGARVFVMEK